MSRQFGIFAGESPLINLSLGINSFFSDIYSFTFLIIKLLFFDFELGFSVVYI